MTHFKRLTIASVVAAALAVPALAQQSGSTVQPGGNTPQQRDGTGMPQSSPTQPPTSMSSGNRQSDRATEPGRAADERYRGDRPGTHGYSSNTVRDVQQALQGKGFDPGPVDGIMGPRTESALRDFQQQQGLTRSGRIDRQTLSALEVRASGPDAGAVTPGAPDTRTGNPPSGARGG